MQTNLYGEASREPLEGWLCFSISDTGIGIKPEDRDRLFMPFEQLDMRKNKSILGTGLGLSITKRIMEIMGGEIAIDSVYGEGSTFTILLPYDSGGDVVTEEDDTDVTVEMLKPLDLPSKKMLIVDDVDVNIIVAAAIFAEYDIEPDSADSGAEAIEMCRTTKYDIIFMDHMMPEMDGLEATEIIRDLPEFGGYYKDVTVIALTANIISESNKDFVEQACGGLLLSKPIDKKDLVKQLYNRLK